MSWRHIRWGGAAAALAVMAGAAGTFTGAGAPSAAAATSASTSAATSASTPAFVWGPARPVPISSSIGQDADVTGMSCPAPGDCTAAGHYYNGALPGFVIQQENGVWGAAQPISGLSPLSGSSGVTVNSVSCASPGNCAVAGSVYAPYPTSGSAYVLRGFVVSETNGVWGTADILPPPVVTAKLSAGKLLSVSCSAPGDCVAGGLDSTDYQTTMAEVVEETNGNWGAPTLLPGAPAFDGVESVSCTAPGECTAALSSTRTGYAGALATENGGTWSVQAVPGLPALAASQERSSVESVSCPSAGDCTAAGDFSTSALVRRLFVVTEQGGTWGQASVLADGPVYAPASIAPSQIPLSCAAPGDCALATDGAIADQVNGTWASGPAYPALPVAGAVTVTALSCPSAGNCSAGGFVSGSSNSIYAFVISETNGTWGKAVQVAGTGNGADVMALSCATADSCAASGTAGTGGLTGFFTEKVPVAPTATAIRLPAQSVPFGHEQAETVTVTVSAASGTPEGAVTVRSGSATVCAIHLADGHGSCALGATRFRAGQIQLAASYAGPAWYAASASPAVSFTVTRAGTRTALSLSARVIRYRHENAERLSVRVRPRYAGTAAGTVAVTAGRVTVCVIRLSGGGGACRVPASKLRPGTYHLVARYRGNGDFIRSVSPAVRLRVTK